MNVSPISSLTLRDYHHHHDASWLYDLWHRALSSKWSISMDELFGRLHSASICLVAEGPSGRIAFCAARCRPSGAATLLVLLVDPVLQRQGVGSKLLHALEDRLRHRSAARFSLGSDGDGDFFWQGIPVESGIWPFFARMGWLEHDRSSDLILELAGYRTPPWVFDRSSMAGISLYPASMPMRDLVLDFEQIHFPVWSQYYEGSQSYLESNVLVAADRSGAILGTVLLSPTISVPWKPSLGERCGSLGVLGVARSFQGRGVGLALAARSAEILQQRGCSAVHIGWTGLVDWYARLGAKPWAEYHMSSRLMGSRPTS